MKPIGYQIIRSARKTVAIQILPDGQVVVRAPRGIPGAQIGAFVKSKEDWICRHIPEDREKPETFSAARLQELKEQAAQVITDRVKILARQVGVDYGRITLRYQRTRWGSCSARGNLNFNCLLMLAPPEVLDYVVLHELCHRKQMNHTAAFWSEVEKVCPQYKSYRKWLRENGPGLLGGLPRQI